MEISAKKYFLTFTYAAIRRYGDKQWVAHSGIIEFNPVYTVSCSVCEKGNFGDAHDVPYIIELSNGTKFLTFFNDIETENLMSERGEMANRYAKKSHHEKVKQLIHLFNR